MASQQRQPADHAPPTSLRARAAAKVNLGLYVGPLRADGRYHEIVDELERNANDPQFDFQYPGLAEAGTFLDRPPILAYEETRFEQYYTPDADALTNLLSATGHPFLEHLLRSALGTGAIAAEVRGSD